MSRYFSGITPSSAKGLHLGNYLGAVQQHVALQGQGETIYFIANLHSLNTVYDPALVASNTLNTYIDWLALGLDPAKSIIFVQSDIPAIPQLQTILNNCVTLAEMKRMHAFKDKLAENADTDTISMGLFNYPILMSADILAFEPDFVPVGEDQAQHLEICREMARTFNNRYGDILKIPELKLHKTTARVLGNDGERKMGKSLGNDLTIFAEEKEVRQQIFATITDRNRIHPTDPGDPDKNVIFSWMRMLDFDREKQADYEARYRAGTVGDVEVKKVFYEHFLDYFKTHRARRTELEKDEASIRQIMAQAAAQANQIAEEVLAKVRTAVGVE